jgi:hypothetical protein
MQCRKCLISDRIVSAHLNHDKLCNYCSGERRFGVLKDPAIMEQFKNQESLKQEFSEIISTPKGKGDYDCLLALSGGKDSAYLLWYLQQNSSLRILTQSIDTGFETDLAKSNIDDLIQKTGIDHIWNHSAIPLLNKIYRYYLTHNSAENTVNNLCGACTQVWHSILIRTASELQIPYIFMGYSPDQIEHYFFRVPESKLHSEEWFPENLPAELLTLAERQIFWGSHDIYSCTFIPSIIFPYHVWQDYSAKSIREELSVAGLLPISRSSQLLTNCRINWLMIYRDLNNLHYNPYTESVSYLIRNGYEKRWLWKLRYLYGNIILRYGLFIRRELRKTLDQLDLTVAELLK